MDNNEFHTVRGYQLLNRNKHLLTSAMEDYLEMIYRNCETEGFMRINHLADMLNVKSSSATKMVQKLGMLGLLKYKKYGMVFLTEDGMELGRYLLQRHAIIENFLAMLGAKEGLLAETELIEHHIGSDTLNNIDLFNKFIKRYPELLKSFEKYKADVPK